MVVRRFTYSLYKYWTNCFFNLDDVIDRKVVIKFVTLSPTLSMDAEDFLNGDAVNIGERESGIEKFLTGVPGSGLSNSVLSRT